MASVYVSTVRMSDERAIAPVVFRLREVGQALAPEHHVVWSFLIADETERKWLYRRLTDRALARRLGHGSVVEPLRDRDNTQGNRTTIGSRPGCVSFSGFAPTR